jgi:DNA-binding LytR/AlgR family response regulator
VNEPLLQVLVADDESPAREELAWLLEHDSNIGSVHTAATGADVLRILEEHELDALFLDIRMPGLDGLDVARLLSRFKQPPRVVFVTAYDEHAVEAFDLRAVDYVLKPVRAERLSEAVRRVVDSFGHPPSPEGVGDETIAVELGGVTRFINRSDVRYAEAHGDYARLHTADGNHLVRVPLATLEEAWSEAGFVRIHRSHLVALRHIDELRIDSGKCAVRIGDHLLQVSRRHTAELRDRLVRPARPGQSPS